MERNRYVWLFATVLVVGSAASLLATPTVATGPLDRLTDATPAIADGRITDVAYRGNGGVWGFDESLALWQSAEHSFS